MKANAKLDQPGRERPGERKSGRGLHPAPLSAGDPPRRKRRGFPLLDEDFFQKKVSEGFHDQYLELTYNADRLFTYLFAFQWALAILLSFASSELNSRSHLNTYSTVLLGSIIAGIPISLNLFKPRQKYNRTVTAVCQMFFSMLFMRLTNGQVETQFSIFASLALISFYRDWRAITLATSIAILDLAVFGIFLKQSAFGIFSVSPYKPLEHIGWILVEDVILWFAIKLALLELRTASESQVKLLIEQAQLRIISEIAIISNESKTLHEAIHRTLNKVCLKTNWPIGHAYLLCDHDPDLLLSTRFWYLENDEFYEKFKKIREDTHLRKNEGLPGKVLTNNKLNWILSEKVEEDSNFSLDKIGFDLSTYSTFAFPIVYQENIIAVLEFYSKQQIYRNDPILDIIANAGRQLGQVWEREDADNKIQLLNHTLEHRVIARTREIEYKNEELAKSQQMVANSSKMSALGEMAGGVAHEINNPLAILKSVVGQIQDLIDEESIDKATVKKMAEKAETMTDRIAKIVKGLQSFSRDGKNDPFQPILVQQLIDETLSFCEARFKHNGVKVEVQEFQKDLTIEGRATQISQVLLNLLNNAHDAIEKEANKWIKISVSNLENMIEIRVMDCGHGIPLEVQKKMFTPFFTTKQIGKGTGLGLSVSIGIIETHCGQLLIDNEAKNTCFLIMLPKKQKYSVPSAA